MSDLPVNPENPSLENSTEPTINGTTDGHVDPEGDNPNSESESEEAPLFEQDEVVEGKRKRNSTIRLAQQISNQEKEAQIIKNSKPKEENLGKGSHLYNMKSVKQTLNEMEKDKKFDDIKTLYKFCTGTGTVKATEVKQKLLRFKGLPFTVEDNPEKDEKHQEILGLYPTSSLNWCMKVFGIEKPQGVQKEVEVDIKKKNEETGKMEPTGEKKKVMKTIGPDKDALLVACMKWLYCPKAVKPKKVAKKKPANPKKSEKRKNADKESGKITSPTKKQKPDKTSLLYDANDDSSDDDKPLKPAAEKPKKKPGKKELRRCINKLLKGADLEVVTMKNICNQVYDSFPEHREHCIEKKAEIKTLVKEYIASH